MCLARPGPSSGHSWGPSSSPTSPEESGPRTCPLHCSPPQGSGHSQHTPPSRSSLALGPNPWTWAGPAVTPASGASPALGRGRGQPGAHTACLPGDMGVGGALAPGLIPDKGSEARAGAPSRTSLSSGHAQGRERRGWGGRTVLATATGENRLGPGSVQVSSPLCFSSKDWPGSSGQRPTPPGQAGASP